MAAASGVRSYAQILVEDYGADEVWTGVQSAADAYVNAARAGSFSGVTAQNAAGPVTGTLAGYWDGTNDYWNVYTSGGGVGLADIFNGGTGAIVGWLKADSGAWTDAANRSIINLLADGNNYIRIYKTTVSNTLRFEYKAGGTAEVYVHTYSSLTWTSFYMRWDQPGDIVQYGINGSQVGGDFTGIGTWAGSLNATQTTYGALNTAPSLIWKGHLAYISLWAGTAPSIATYTAMDAAAATAGAD